MAFSSQADDLVAGDYNASPDAFLYVITEPVLGAPDKTLISEPAGSTTFRVWLSHPPLAPVTVPVHVTTPSACTAPAAILLDGGNWEAGVVVTVTAVDDAVIDGPEPCLVALDPLTGADVNLAGFDLPDVALTVADDDTDAVHLLSDGFESGGVAAWAVAAGD